MTFSEEDDYIYETPKGQISVIADLAFVKIYPTLSPDLAINAVAREIRSIVKAQSQIGMYSKLLILVVSLELFHFQKQN